MKRVLNKHRDQIPVNAIYIGRGSKWGNPFIMGKDGDRETVIRKYKELLEQKIHCGQIRAFDLAELADRPLVCFCAPKACHGDILAAFSDAALKAMVTSAVTFHKEFS